MVERRIEGKQKLGIQMQKMNTLISVRVDRMILEAFMGYCLDNVQADLDGISTRIKYIQKHEGLTDAQMAEKLHFSLGTYRGYKNGRAITLLNAMQFAYVFGLNLNYFLRGDKSEGIFIEENESSGMDSRERMAMYRNLMESDFSDYSEEEKKKSLKETLELSIKLLSE